MIESKELRKVEKYECALCFDEVEECSECQKYPDNNNEKWCCYNDGDEHYCEECWNKLNPKQKKRKND